MKRTCKLCVALCAALFPALAYAQTTARANAADPAASAPRFEYRSAFEDYRAWKDEPAGSWRALNSEAGQIGGHAGHLAPTTKTPAPPQSAPVQSESQTGTTATGSKPAVAKPPSDHNLHQMK